MRDERRVSSITSAQRGLITRAQLEAAGISRRMVESRLRSGRFERVCRGVYRLGGLPPDEWQAGLATCLAVGGTVAVSHRTAAAMWGADVAVSRITDVTLVRSRSVRLGPRTADVVLHRSLDLTADQIIRRHRVPVTDPHRTLVDLGAVVGPDLVEDALDSMISRKLVTAAGVRGALDRLAGPGRTGCGVLRGILERRSIPEPRVGRSALESRLVRLCRSAGLPEPVFQHEVFVGGQRRVLDFAFPELRLALEADGFEWRTRPDAFEDDRVRGNALELAGWRVLHFTWTQITRRPQEVIAVIAGALAGLGAPVHLLGAQLHQVG